MSDGDGWRSIRKVRAHEQVIEQIEAQILAGRLQAGDRLPSERQLCELLGVSRASVREALRVLEALEIVTARPGTGSESGSIISGRPGRAMTSLLRLQLALSSFEMDEVIEARVMIEAWGARTAATRAGADDLSQLDDVLARMRDPSLEPYEFNEFDTMFHVGISEASGNRLISHLMQAIRDAVRQQMMVAFDNLGGDWRSTAAQLDDEHRGILEAMTAGDPDLAAERVEQHIRNFYGIMPPQRRANALAGHLRAVDRLQEAGRPDAR